MGEELYAAVIARGRLAVPCRVYAPVGAHEDLLPYLVRRLLENGANTSFVNRIVDETRAGRGRSSRIRSRTVDAPRRRPRTRASRCRATCIGPSGATRAASTSPTAPRSRELAGAHAARVAPAAGSRRPSSSGEELDGASQRGAQSRRPPPRSSARVATADAGAGRARRVAARGARAAGLGRTPAREARAAMLERAADLFEANLPEFIALCVREAGKTVPDAIAEVREAVDFLRYYAARARADFGAPQRLPGPTGETQRAVAARPRRVRLHQPVELPARDLHRPGRRGAGRRQRRDRQARRADAADRGAGGAAAARRPACPADVLHFLPGDGAQVGARAGRATRASPASPSPARPRRRALINRALAARDGADPRADRRDRRPERDDRRHLRAARAGGARRRARRPSTAPASAARRCACCSCRRTSRRRVLRAARGRMDELVVGDPALLATDVGPVIDAEAARRAGAARGRASCAARAGRTACRLDAATRAAPSSRRSRCEIDVARRARARGVRPGPARGALPRARPRRGGRRDQRHRLRPHARHPQPHRRHGARASRRACGVGNVYVNRNRSARSSACSRSAARACRAPARRPAARTTCSASPPSARSRSTPPRPAATRRCWRWSRGGRTWDSASSTSSRSASARRVRTPWDR